VSIFFRLVLASHHAWQKEGGEEKPTLAENAEEAARGG